MSRRAAEAAGRRGERMAAWWLRLQGWRIIAERVKLPQGEVDLVAQRGRTTAFIEVKWRARAADLDQAIDGWRLRRVAAAAEILRARLAPAGHAISIDVILLAPGRFPRHVRNAWQP